MTEPRHPDDLETRLRALSPRRPSPGLRAQVLRQAAAGLARPVARGWRLWDSWTFRWGWAVGLAALAIVGTLSEHSFRNVLWGGGEPIVASSEVAASRTASRAAGLHAVLGIENQMTPPAEAAALGWGDPNRCDQRRALAALAGADATPRRIPGPPRDTRKLGADADRRFT